MTPDPAPPPRVHLTRPLITTAPDGTTSTLAGTPFVTVDSADFVCGPYSTRLPREQACDKGSHTG